jgi:glycosyltransferase involved in cell wall biosynthesis
MRKRILCIPPWHGWYVEAHAEYLIKYLADEFFMEIATIPYPPYKDFLSRFPNESPFMRNPDEYDLIWPMWAGHWGVNQDEYAHKTAVVIYQPGEGRTVGCKVVGATTPIVEEHLAAHKQPFHKLKFGIDTNLFCPVPELRNGYCCDKLHIGYVGNHANVRHMLSTVISPLRNLEGVHLMLFPASWQNNGGVFTDWDGWNLMPYVVTGDKRWTGMPNIYNRMDVLLRIDQDPAYSFPTLEAAACGVPVIATNSGIDHLIINAGGGIMITGDRNQHLFHPEVTADLVKKAVVRLRDNRDEAREMGMRGRDEIEANWTWDKFINQWREFFREGVL